MTTAQVLWMNIPLMVLAFGLTVGASLWVVLRDPERRPAEPRRVPADLRAARPTASAPAGARARDGQRGLVSM